LLPRPPVILTHSALLSFVRDAFMRACLAGVRAACGQRLRVWSLRALCAALVFTMLAPRAWDAETMQRAAVPLGPQAVGGVRALQAILSTAVGQDDALRLATINEFFNRRIVFATDLETWGQNDYWASPLETLAKGRGDCEDYVIAKYFSLMAAGIPSSRLRLVYVRAVIGGPGGVVQAHMVLAYYAQAGAEPLILDNLIGEIRPASRRSDLEPVFSFNGEGLWQGVGAQSAGDPVARLSRWREVLAKARAEGFQ
jgi:predicted transglutaminase-like cysteine proteinase